MLKPGSLPLPAVQFKALTFLSMIYITSILAADVLIYKIMHFGSIVLTVGSFVTPFWFVTADIVAEIYGFRVTRRMIWSGIACGFLFTIICVTLINLPSPDVWPKTTLKIWPAFYPQRV